MLQKMAHKAKESHLAQAVRLAVAVCLAEVARSVPVGTWTKAGLGRVAWDPGASAVGLQRAGLSARVVLRAVVARQETVLTAWAECIQMVVAQQPAAIAMAMMAAWRCLCLTAVLMHLNPRLAI
jgi:hypothetical protein